MIPDDSVDDEPPHKARGSLAEWFRTWRWLFWLFGLLGLVGLFYAEENWRGYRAWETYKQQRTAGGERFEAVAFIPPRVADDENFAMTPALTPLFNFVPGTQRWRDTNAPVLFQTLMARYDAASRLVKSPSAVRLNSWVRGRTDLSLWEAAFSLGTNDTGPRKPLLVANSSSREAAAGVLEALSDYNEVFEELRSASRRPHSRFNIRYDEPNPAAILLPHLSKVKQFCLVLQLRASAEVALGHTDDAHNDLDLMFSLTDASRDEPILISQLVRMSELQLALQPLAEGLGQWSEPQLRALQERLRKFDFCADVKHALEAERAFFGCGMIEYVRRSPNKIRLMDELGRVGDSPDGSVQVGALLTVAPSGWLYFEQLSLSRDFDQCLLPLIEVTARQIRPGAVRESEDAVARITAGTPVSRFLHHQFFSALLLPALSRVSQKTAFAQTAVDTASVACALERYRLAHGQFPDSLEKLTPQFIASLPHDLINGNPLTYRLNPDSHYLLYSVGWNETDDGGRTKQTKGGETDQREGDWVWADGF